MTDSTDSHNQHGHQEDDACLCRPATVATAQTLDEMDFERGIWSAALYNDINRIKEFIRRGDTDRRDNGGYTALHYAARQGHLEICLLLIDGNCDVNARTNGGATPLHRAAMMGHSDIIKLLFRSNADVNLQDEDGATALHRSAAKGFLEVSRELLRMSTKLKSIQDKKGRIAKDLVPQGNAKLRELLSL